MIKFDVVVSSDFAKQLKPLAKKYKSIKQDLQNLISRLEENPKLGESLGKKCYKIRMKITSKSPGKSGGARVITYVLDKNSTVTLISIYDKSSTESIPDSEISDLLKRLST